MAAIARLAAEALEHRAVHHPYLRALAEGAFPDPISAVADFARNYHGYAAHFQRYLATVMARLEAPAHRHALLANLTEESGQYSGEELTLLEKSGVERRWIEGIPHSALFSRFCRAVGGEPEQQLEELEVTCWREMLLAVLQFGSPAEAVGAIGLGTENIVRTIYRPICQAIARVPGLTPEQTVFFPLHVAVDDDHQQTLQRIAAELAASPQGLRDLAKGMRKALALRSSFWDWLEARARRDPRERAHCRTETMGVAPPPAAA